MIRELTLWKNRMTDLNLAQRFSIPVLAPPALHICMSLFVKHLIQIISLLEVRSMHELCSDWHAPYTGSIAPYSLSRGNPLKFILFRNIQSWICAAQRLHARTSVTSYTSVNYTILIHVLHTSMHFEWNIYVRFELESWRNILWCPLRRALTFE